MLAPICWHRAADSAGYPLTPRSVQPIQIVLGVVHVEDHNHHHARTRTGFAHRPMRIHNVIAPLLVAGASAVAIAVAPLANAAPTGPICTSTGANSTLCHTNGNAQVSAAPPPVNYRLGRDFARIEAALSTPGIFGRVAIA